MNAASIIGTPASGSPTSFRLCRWTGPLQTRHPNLPIQGEPAEWLLAVRRGEVLVDEWWNRSLELDAELEELSDDDSIPAGPNRAAIEAWSVQTHLHYWERFSRD
jgi:hypothetical protein